MSHPFLDAAFHIPWSQLQPKHIEPDISKGLEIAQQRIDVIAQQALDDVSYDSTLGALEKSTEDLSRAWTYVSHLDSVCNSDELRAAYNKMLPQVSEFFTKIPLNSHLWNVLKTFSNTDEAKKLTGARKRFLEETLADFKESGADLAAADKQRLAEINAELAKITQKYSENVLDSTNAWERIVDDPGQLAGLPQSAQDAAKDAALKKGIGTEDSPKWRFTLQMPSLLPALKYLDDNALRKEIWTASSKIGATQEHDNTELIWQALELRQQKAQLLGKDHFADFVLSRRMAKNGKTAIDFIADLHRRVKPAFDQDIAELEAYKADKIGQPVDRLQPWETGYWAEKRRMELFDLDEEELRPYFPINTVIGGMFQITEKIFGIRIVERSAVYIDTNTQEQQLHDVEDGKPPVEVWHPDVRYYEVYDEDAAHIGSFYADWHPRESKRGGAWMNDFVTGTRHHDGSFSPHLGIVCGNLSPAVGDKPALLTHDEVTTIFHEFGHLLHHLLGKVDVQSLNGINVAWDFVELPSQFLENWCWESAALALISGHYQTQEPLPAKLLDKMLAARNYMEASTTMRQLSLGKMDLEMHANYAQFQGRELDTVIDGILEGYNATLKTQPPSIVRRFGHLFSSPTGYAAGYYSYKWAEVLDADAFTRFQNEGVFNATVGREFRDKILSKGNSEPPEKLYRDFMGRGPDLNALLIRSGLLDA